MQNVVLDSIGQMWIVDSGIPYGSTDFVSGGAKIMAFDVKTRALLKTYLFPDSILEGGTNLNDLRINNTAGTAGFAFVPDESPKGVRPQSIPAPDTVPGTTSTRLTYHPPNRASSPSTSPPAT